MSRIRSLSIGAVLFTVGACSDAGLQEPKQGEGLESVQQGITGTYRLKAVHSGKCLTVAGSSTSDGGNVEQRTCGTGLNQQWTLLDCGSGIHVLRNKNSNKSMKVNAGSTADGANVEQRGGYDCSTTLGSPRFRFINKGGTPVQYQLQAVHSSKCVDVAGGVSATGDGVNVHQWTCHENSNQRFTLESVSSEPPPPTGSLPTDWSTRDIGGVQATGSASYSNGVYTVKGSGADIWGYADEFRFAYRQLTGDGMITARVTGLENKHAWTKGGVMIRETLNADSKHAFMTVTPTSGIAFQRRTGTGGSSVSTSSSGGVGTWVRVQRSGSTLTGFRSTDGSTWSAVGSASISMQSAVYVGLAVTSHVDGTLATGTLSNVSVATGGTTPPPPPPGITWRPANLTYYTSWPACCPDSTNYDPNADKTECVVYNGCTWAGYFAALSGRQTDDWVKAHNIAAVHEKDFATLKLKTLRIRQRKSDGTYRQIDATVYDMCSDSDCNGCCTANASRVSPAFLIDLEHYTADRFGSRSGTVEWYCTNC